MQYIQIGRGTKFQFKQAILIFWTELTRRKYFRSKTEKLNISIEFSIFELVYIPNFVLIRQSWFSGPNLLEKGKIMC